MNEIVWLFWGALDRDHNPQNVPRELQEFLKAVKTLMLSLCFAFLFFIFFLFGLVYCLFVFALEEKGFVWDF